MINKLLLKKYKYPYEAGCDEAGRGCLAGPVVAAAVILNPRKKIPTEIQDSKKMSSHERDIYFNWIMENAWSHGIGIVGPKKIDEINILHASFLAMHHAIDRLHSRPRHLLIDGNRFTSYEGIGHTCIVRGDAKYYSIAAASILAKVSRDRLMTKLHNEFPQYGWDQNKGYPTKQHRDAIMRHGRTKQHRVSFQLKKVN